MVSKTKPVVVLNNMNNTQIKKTIELLMEEIAALDSFNLELIDSVIYKKVNLLKNVLDKDDGFRKKLIKSLLINFKKAREGALKLSYQDEGFELQAHIQISLYSLIKKLAKYSGCASDEIKQLIESQDDWLIATGFELLNGSDSAPRNELIQRTFQIMSDNIPNTTPHGSLANWLDKDAGIFDEIMARFDSENVYFRKGVLYSFHLAKKLTIEAEALVLSILQDKNNKARESAILPAGKCFYLRDEAITLLLKEFDSDKWYCRGYAATAIAALKISDVAILKKITGLFGDSIGHDWSAEESAIEALGTLGELARPCIPEILALLHNELIDENLKNSTENFILDICEALGKIDNGTEPVINALIKVVDTCQYVAVTSALRALGKFGEKSKAVLPYLDNYIYDDEYLEGDFMVDDIAEINFFKSLYKIAGADSREVKAYLKSLKSSPFSEVRKFANDFEKSILPKSRYRKHNDNASP